MQQKSELAKGMYVYRPSQTFVAQGFRKQLVQKIFAVGKRVSQSSSTLHLAVKLLDRVFSAFKEDEIST